MLVYLFAFLAYIECYSLQTIYALIIAPLARRLGIVVEQVEIGWGPTLYSHQRANEVWKWKLIPITASVKLRTSKEANSWQVRNLLPGSYEAASAGRRLVMHAAAPLAQIILGLALLGVAVVCGGDQLVAPMVFDKSLRPTEAPSLTFENRASTWEGQSRLAEDTIWYYCWRLITPREFDGWGGPVALLVTAGRVGASSILGWVTLIGLVSMVLGGFNLLPIPPLNGFHILRILASVVAGNRSCSDETITSIYKYGLLFLLLLFVRMIWLDAEWVWHNLPNP